MAGKGKAVHTVPHQGRWAVKREGNERATSVHDTQAEADRAGREIARRDGVEYNLHNRQGQVRVKDSYGNDPNPPKDQK